jgi:hypothetical protein
MTKKSKKGKINPKNETNHQAWGLRKGARQASK